MKNFIVYLDNGQILRTGICPDNDFKNQGKNVIEGVANDEKQYINDNIVVDIPLKPGKFYLFNYDNKQWEFDSVSADAETRNQRNIFLAQSDWTQIPNGPLTQEQQQAWAVYRQELRDLTSQSGYPFNVIWPTPPQG